MKNVLVLEFITSFGGVQAVYKNILPEMAKENKVFFLNPYSEMDDLEIGQLDNIEVVKMLLNSEKALGWKRGVFSKILICLKYGVKYLAYFFKIAKFVRKKEINLLYVSGKKEFLFAYLIKCFCGVPYIYHAHGFGKVTDINRFTKIAINNAEYVICVSNDVKSKIQKSGIESENIVVINNGLSLQSAEEKIKNAKRSDEREKGFLVVFAGTIQEQKGVLTLVKAVMQLRKQGCNIKLNLVGVCNNESYMKEIKNEASAEVVSICGFAENIYEYFLNADLIVLPSKEESFGMVLLEAMYARKAVIGSNIGGIPDIIVDGQTGYIFECDNHIDLAEKILKVYEDRDLCCALGEKGFARVCEVFTAEKQGKRINALINGEGNK